MGITLEYYQGKDKLYYKWTNISDNFKMPIDIELNGAEKRINPTKAIQTETINEFSVIHFKDWEFYFNKKKNSGLAK